jgi:sporulation integral membrane protein YtvI
MDSLFEKLNKLALFFIIYSLIFITFFKTLPYTLPFVLAILFALILKNPTRYLVNKLKLSNSIASLITSIIFFTVIILLLLYSITALTSELISLTRNISTYIAAQSQNPYELFERFQKYYNNIDPTLLNSIQKSATNAAANIVNSTAKIGMLAGSYVISIISSIPYVAMVIIFTLVATYFFTKDISEKNSDILNTFLPNGASKILYVFNEGKRMLVSYLKSYLLIIFITFAVTLIGFLILNVNYAVLLSVMCAVLDVLPVVGIAAVYIPLAIIYLLSGNYIGGLGLIILYALVFVIRQIAEPRIMSTSLGLHPVAVLAAIFIGLEANGIAGMFFCMFLVVFYNILKKVEVI